MTDVLLEIAANRPARRVVEALRLPLPLPRRLERATGAWQRRELAGRVVAVVGFATDSLAEPFAHMLAEAGAEISVKIATARQQTWLLPPKVAQA